VPSYETSSSVPQFPISRKNYFLKSDCDSNSHTKPGTDKKGRKRLVLPRRQFERQRPRRKARYILKVKDVIRTIPLLAQALMK